MQTRAEIKFLSLNLDSRPARQSHDETSFAFKHLKLKAVRLD